MINSWPRTLWIRATYALIRNANYKFDTQWKYKSQPLRRFHLLSFHLFTFECSYNAVTFVTILKSALRQKWQKVSQTLDAQNTPYTSPSWPSYGLSFVRILAKTDRIITAPRCILYDSSHSERFGSFAQHRTILLLSRHLSQKDHPKRQLHWGSSHEGSDRHPRQHGGGRGRRFGKFTANSHCVCSLLRPSFCELIVNVMGHIDAESRAAVIRYLATIPV